MNDSERSIDPVTRAASAMGRGPRPGLSKAWSVSSPNMPGMMMENEIDILERIRDLEGQIAAQQVLRKVSFMILISFLSRTLSALNNSRYQSLDL